MSKILDGKKLAEEILKNLKREIKAKRLKLTLAVIQVGKDPVSSVFVGQKRRACERIGVSFKLFTFPKEIKASNLKNQIQKIVQNPSHSGVVIQLPLPAQIFQRKTWAGEPKRFSPEDFLNLIPEKKDVDVLSEKSFMKFFRGTSEILPPVAAGIARLFEKYKIRVKGKNVVIIGAGKLTGLPAAIWGLQQMGTVTVINAFTRDPAYFTRKADIIISGVGKPGLIKGNMVKKGVVVVDCGTKKVEEKIRGDVDFKTVVPKASYITPVPGGVGPMTVVMLLWNLVKMNKK